MPTWLEQARKTATIIGLLAFETGKRPAPDWVGAVAWRRNRGVWQFWPALYGRDADGLDLLEFCEWVRGRLSNGH